MAISKAPIVFAILLVLASGSFAGCASEAYSKTCGSCTFDSNGKVDQSCKSGFTSSGTTCVSVSYPIMAAKYAEGKCPQVDSCADELRSCTAQYTTGNDSEDCREGSTAICYASADYCVKSAAIKCGEIESPCPGSATGFILLFASLAFVRLRN
jgi:hypothetical protein